MLEACHRGFLSIVKLLLGAPRGAGLAYVPDDAGARAFPFARPPPQCALGEACRCGFNEMAKLLLERGAPKDAQNRLGWTALHEAAFHNHVEVSARARARPFPLSPRTPGTFAL